MHRDQHGLRRRLQGIEARMRKGDSVAALRQSLAEDIGRSMARRQARAERLPHPRFSEALPVSARRDEIARAIAQHPVVIVCGETGSGKTTQLPKICLSLGRGVAGMIGHTQPRRIAARSVAARLAQELETELGQAVGYKVRFSERVHDEAYIKLMTDGILLAETQEDRFLDRYDTLIIDEAHERSLNIDFLLGYLKQLLPKRPDLKLIITSATIDPERFSRHFDQAPVIEVSGRTYPVEVRYRPVQGNDEDQRDRDLPQAILDAVDEVCRLGPGDMLIFLSGERAIRETAEALGKHRLINTEILPLYARLGWADQAKVFASHTGRRIVLATNVAETSLTVPGIRYVIDPGFARISRYSHRSKVQRLPIEPISQASADQRKGRCGRISAGVCIRMYTEEDYQTRPRFTEPEILRTHLASVILQMKALGFGDVERFPFVEPPDARMINDGFKLLEELGAVDPKRALTAIGKRLTRLPLDPRIARMVLAAHEEGSLREVLIIAAALSIQDPRERPLDARQAADEKQARFQDERSDFLSYLKLWAWFEEQRKHLSQRKLREACREHFLSFVRLREWRDVHQQLTQIVREQLRFRLNEVPAEYGALHRALLTGLLGNIGFNQEGTQYLGARGVHFQIFPGSGLFKAHPKWVMAAELMETRRLYALTCARIEPGWVERAAGHLAKRSYFEPHWEKRPAQVAAFEKVTLYGLTLVARRKVNYGPIAPGDAREIFIRSALVEGDYQTRAAFFAHNREQVAEIEALEHKSRRQDVLVDEAVIFDFYDRRLPAGIYNGAHFERWRQEAERQDPRLLFLSRDYLMRHGAEGITEAQFPDGMTVNGIRLSLDYHFEPGHPADGVTVNIPVIVINQLTPARFQWLVPGLLRERVIALLKSLPKALRKSFVPVPDFADVCLKVLTPGDEPLLPALTHQLRRLTGVTVPDEAWQPDSLPDYLRTRFRILDEQGQEIGTGRDLKSLQRTFAEAAQQSFQRMPAASGLEKEGITRWDFGELPEQIELQRHGTRLTAYPALEDRERSVALTLQDSPEKAARVTRAGLRRLFRLQLSEQIKRLERQLPGFQELCLRYTQAPASPWCGKENPSKAGRHKFNGACETLRGEIVASVLDQAFLDGDEPVRDAEVFEGRLQAGRARLVAVADELCGLIERILGTHQGVIQTLNGTLPRVWMKAVADIHGQLQYLIYRGFLADVPVPALRHYPRYLKAIERRLQRLEQAPDKDRPKLAEISPLWEAYLQQAQALRQAGRASAELERYRWMLEELRVSLFAQELKTAIPVSAKRLQEQWRRVLKVS